MAASLAFPSTSATGTPIALGTAATTLHVTRASKRTELSVLVFNNDAATDYNATLLIAGTTVGVVKIEKLAGPYQLLPPIVLDAGVTVAASCPTASKLYALLTVTEFD